MLGCPINVDYRSGRVGCFSAQRPLRQYFSLSRLPESGRWKSEVTDERKNIQTTLTRLALLSSMLVGRPGAGS